YTGNTSTSTRNSESHTGYLSLVRRFNPQLSLQLNGGMGITEFSDGTQSTAPWAVLQTTYNFGPASSAAAGFSYSLSTTEVAAFRSSDNASLFAQINHRLTNKLRGNLNLSYVLSRLGNPNTGGVF